MSYNQYDRCMPGCPDNIGTHCEVLCPSTSTCNGDVNTRNEHECLLCCCFVPNLIAYIISTPFCICNMCYKTGITMKQNAIANSITVIPSKTLPSDNANINIVCHQPQNVYD